MKNTTLISNQFIQTFRRSDVQTFRRSDVQTFRRSDVQTFKSKLFLAFVMLVLSTHFANAQDHQLLNGSTPTSTDFLQSTPFPATTSTLTQNKVGQGYDAITTRGIFYGGNLGVATHTFNFGDQFGKWSFTGQWDRLISASYPFATNPATIPGTDYLANYHRFGNYAAIFGIRSATSTYSTPGESTTFGNSSSIKNAVISWSTENGQDQNRLVFESINGVHPGASGGVTTFTATEWATILSNGNIGSGISTPTAQFQLKPLNSPGSSLFEILDGSSNPMFTYYEGSIGGIFNTIGQQTITSPSGVTSSSYKPFRVIDKTGTGYELFSILDNGLTTIRPCTTAIGTDKVLTLKNNSGSEFFYFQNGGDGWLNGALTIKGKSSGTPLTVTNNSNEPIFRVTNAGDIFLDKLAPVSGTLNLKVDNTGKIIATTVPYTANTAWEVGGNTFAGGSLYELGSFSYDDVNLVAGGVTSISLDGALATRGQIQIIKPLSMGGNSTYGYTTPTTSFTALLRSMSIYPPTGGSFYPYLDEGVLRCENYNEDELLTVFNEGISMFEGKSRINKSGEIYTNGGIMTDDDIIPGGYTPSGGSYTVYPVDIGTIAAPFDDIRCSGDVYSSAGLLSSDRRLKENIKPIESTLDVIKKLKPVKYNFIKKPGQEEYGFIAQDLEPLLPNVVKVPNEERDKYFVNYTALIPVLTKGIQEQQMIIDSLKQKLDFVFACGQIKDIKNINTQKEVLNQLPLLFQNHPNPFNGFTFIDYFLPINTTNAFLKVIDNNGKLVKAFPINKTGFGQIELDCTNLASGQYYYSLLVNSQLIDTKSMIIATKD